MTNEHIYEEFGEKLKQLRKSKGVTQTQLAEATGITQSAVYNYEKGRRKIPMSVLQKFAVYFELSMSELIGSQPTLTAEEPAWLEEIRGYNLNNDEVNELMNYVRFIITKRN